MHRVLPWMALACCGLCGCGLFRHQSTPAYPTATPPAKTASGESSPWWMFRANGAEGSGGGVDMNGEAGSFLRSQLAKGRGLEQTSQLDEARKVYQKLIERFPERPEAYHRLGIVADRQRRHSEAQRHYERALSIRGEDAQLFNDLGYCHFLQGNLREAEQLFMHALRLSPDVPRYHNNMGMVLGHLGRHQEALREFMQAGSEADAFYNLAFVYAAQDQADQAKECFRRALVIDPTHELASDALRSFELFDEDFRNRGPRAYDMPAPSELVPHETHQEYSVASRDGGEAASGVQRAGHQVRINPQARQQTRALQAESRTRAIQMRAESNAEQPSSGVEWDSSYPPTGW